MGDCFVHLLCLSATIINDPLLDHTSLAAQYGQAFCSIQKYDDAKHTLQPLLTWQPSNIWLADLMTDIDLALKQMG
ncbi:MAG: Beta-barrel assembly-enhancing protease [Sodalis sp.]|nr:MAG: Beta-barrel assembly-enhancing protease [Sodalis sp.]